MDKNNDNLENLKKDIIKAIGNDDDSTIKNTFGKFGINNKTELNDLLKNDDFVKGYNLIDEHTAIFKKMVKENLTSNFNDSDIDNLRKMANEISDDISNYIVKSKEKFDENILKDKVTKYTTLIKIVESYNYLFKKGDIK